MSGFPNSQLRRTVAFFLPLHATSPYINFTYEVVGEGVFEFRVNEDVVLRQEGPTMGDVCSGANSFLTDC